ncbi:MAG: hypothetical protein NTV73_10030 [Hyphomicrobiales bacterium]|nr:hypothetical protein [Hyphomicrobiales bacterium]
MLLLLAAIGIAGAQAASIQTVAPFDGIAPSIQEVGDDVVVDPSIVAAMPDRGAPTPSVIAVADTPSGDTPSIISLGDPAPAGEAMASAPSDGHQGMTSPMVIRGGEVGNDVARPSTSAAPAQSADTGTTPMLDPNDKGTSAKRKALRRQAERLAQEAADGQGQADPSTAPEPMGQ